MIKIYISLNVRNLSRFLLGLIFLATFLTIIIRQDASLLIIFGIILAYLFICLVFFSFTYCKVSTKSFIVRGDFMFFKGQQIQKRVNVNISNIKSMRMSTMKDHTNTNGEPIPYRYKYGDERLFLYGLEKLKCIEIGMSDGSVVRFVTNKYSANQIDKIIQLLRVPLSQV